MGQLKAILEKIKKPSVILSITSQIIVILTLLNVQVDSNIIGGIVTAVCSILVLLGILSDPNTVTKGYGDDLLLCFKSLVFIYFYAIHIKENVFALLITFSKRSPLFAPKYINTRDLKKL